MNEPVSEASMQIDAKKLTPPWLTLGLVYFADKQNVISRQFVLTTTLIQINLRLISPSNLYEILSLIFALPCKFQSIIRFFIVDEWFESCGLATIFLLLKNTSSGGLWNVHTLNVDVWWWCQCLYIFVSLTALTISVINCCCFAWSACCLSAGKVTSSFFHFHEIPNWCVGSAQYFIQRLWSILILFPASKYLAFLP